MQYVAPPRFPHPDRPSHRRPRLAAALDLGTNNCRLLVARGKSTGFDVIDAFSRIVRLGEGLAASGDISDPAQERAIAALKVCAQKIQRHNPGAVRAVATEACRKAANGAAFIERAQQETGLAIEAIDAREEATLSLLGCSGLLSRRAPHAITFDIGGGSTEILWVDTPPNGPIAVRDWVSLPLGVVNLSESHPDYAAMRATVAAQLAAFDARAGVSAKVAAGEAQMMGASGTVTTLAGVHLGLPRYERGHVDGALIGFDAIRGVADMIVNMNETARAAHPCIGRSRADLVVAGCAILDAICAAWPVGVLRVADRGVREGILLNLFGADRPQHLAA